MGRIGRAFARHPAGRHGIKVAAVSDATDARTPAYLLEFDSAYRRFGRPVDYTSDAPVVNGHKIAVLPGQDQGQTDWDIYGAEVVIEATGWFGARGQAARHLTGGAKKVLIAAPGKDADLTVVMGVNAGAYDPRRHDVISAASPTTCRIAPVAKMLNAASGSPGASITAVHACTSDQVLPNGPHPDLRGARPAVASIIPASTSAVRTTGEVLPGLAGLLDGIAVRVPVQGGSLAGLAAQLATHVSAGEVNDAFRAAALGPRTSCATAPTHRLPRHHRRPGLVRLRLRPHPGRRHAGPGVRLVRQRVGLCLPAHRPGRPSHRVDDSDS